MHFTPPLHNLKCLTPQSTIRKAKATVKLITVLSLYASAHITGSPSDVKAAPPLSPRAGLLELSLVLKCSPQGQT